jgi:multidrug efflux pump subunit AcrB
MSSGAGAASRHEIGTGVIGGMVFATIFDLLRCKARVSLKDARRSET